jgi:hypothetical protein
MARIISFDLSDFEEITIKLENGIEGKFKGKRILKVTGVKLIDKEDYSLHLNLDELKRNK